MHPLPLLALLVSPALAEDPPAPAAEPAPEPGSVATVAVGVHVGPSIGVDGLGVGFLPRLEVGWLPGSLRGRLMIFATGAYTTPGAKGTVTDARVGGGAYDWTLRQDQLLLGLGAAVRLSKEEAKVHPELALAPQLYLLTSHADGAADGQAFGETTEGYANWGLLLAVGVGYDLGPGRLMGRLEYAVSPLRGQVTGQATTSAIAPTFGYRFLF